MFKPILMPCDAATNLHAIRRNRHARSSALREHRGTNVPFERVFGRTTPYVVLPDKDAEQGGDLRVIDESGDDYLFAADRFIAIDVPAAVKASLLKAS